MWYLIKNLKYIIQVIIFSIYLTGYALECYVCDKQEKNHEKCLNTITTCEQEQDMCLSEIRWGCKYS